MSLAKFYSTNMVAFRFLLLATFIGIQLSILNYFLGETNHGKNDAETDAVLIFTSMLYLAVSVIPMLVLALSLEKNKLWRRIFMLSILVIPVIWLMLIITYGNPLYYFFGN